MFDVRRPGAGPGPLGVVHCRIAATLLLILLDGKLMDSINSLLDGRFNLQNQAWLARKGWIKVDGGVVCGTPVIECTETLVATRSNQTGTATRDGSTSVTVDRCGCQLFEGRLDVSA